MKHIYGDGVGGVSLVDAMGSDKTIVNAARVSFGKDNPLPFSSKDKKLIQFLARERHSSPFEHVTFTWRFVVPLFVARQHMRHRTWSYNEISRRYTSDDVQLFVPNELRRQSEDNRQASIDASVPDSDRLLTALENSVQQSLRTYNILISSGVCREQARMVLPQNMYTSYYGTVDLHNAMHFIRLRLDKHAQHEIRLVAQAMLEDIRDVCPVAAETLGTQ